MRFNKIYKIYPILISLVILSFTFDVSAMDYDEATKICDEMSVANKSMAMAAGYDIDELCSNIDLISPTITKLSDDPVINIPRVTASSSSQSIESRKDLASLHPLKEFIKPFGYDIFANVPQDINVPNNITVPSNYLLGPGDELSIILFGKINQSSIIKINRDGFVQFPELGPILLAGLTFDEAKEMLKSRIETQVIGTKVNISMGSLRTIQVFVLGEAYRPGAYTLSSLATVTQALLSAGGVTDIASLRRVQVKRGGNIISNLDLYDLLLSGEMKDDIRLQAGDTVFIPSVARTITIEGEVIRPAIYELKNELTVDKVINLAGGLSPRAFSRSMHIERVLDNGYMTVIEIDFSTKAGKLTKIKNGDRLRVSSVVDKKMDTVRVSGFINHPIERKWVPGLSLHDIVKREDQFPSQLDLNYGLIIREADHQGELSVISFKPKDLFSRPFKGDHIPLLPRDNVLFFSLIMQENDDLLIDNKSDIKTTKTNHNKITFVGPEIRLQLLNPIISRLKSQVTINEPAKIVEVRGAVRFPGSYPLTPNMTLEDLMNAAGGLLDSAYKDSIEISRQNNSIPQESKLDTVVTNIGEGELLKAQDSVFIKSIPDYMKKDSILLFGEVLFPGEYSFTKGETLTSVINRAGGFTHVADVNAAVFSRKKIKEREQKELDKLRSKLEKELSNQRLLEVNSGEKISEDRQAIQNKVIENFNEVQATGRLVIPLSLILKGEAEDVILEAGDALGVPQYRQEVSVIGEVQRPTSYFYDSQLDYKDYIEQSGGVLETANKKGIYVVRASGEVILVSKKFLSSDKKRIHAGDTIVVPLDIDEDKIGGVELFLELSQILYQLSLGAAAIDSLTN